MRIILYTGKGGVGKTSVAAATALKAAAMGHKTIVLSTDLAHSLSDSFDTKLSGTPTPVAPNLWGQEIDIGHELNAHWRMVQDWLAAFVRWHGVDSIVSEEMAIPPGADELIGLLYIAQYHESQEYDLLVVDCAPTGETLRLLSFPEMIGWYMKRLFPIERRAAVALAPLIRGLTNLPMPSDSVFDSIDFLFKQIEKMRKILSDHEVTSMRLVVNPERMVIKETQRTLTYLNLYAYSTDLVICNRVLPARIVDTYFDFWKESQARHYQLIEESFAPIPILSIPLLDREVVGLDMLRFMGVSLFGDKDPAQVFFRGHPHQIEKRDGLYLMKLQLPFVEKKDLSIIQSGDELAVQAGSHRRNIILPRTLAQFSIVEASYVDQCLQLVFGPKESEGKKREGPAKREARPRSKGRRRDHEA